MLAKGEITVRSRSGCRIRRPEAPPLQIMAPGVDLLAGYPRGAAPPAVTDAPTDPNPRLRFASLFPSKSQRNDAARPPEPSPRIDPSAQ